MTTAPSPCDAPALTEFKARSLVVIPALNEEACIGGVIDALRKTGFQHIRVVDNASTDNTGEAAKFAGAEVIRLEKSGYGLACWEGCLNPPPGTEWLVFCNADASDDFDAYAEFANLASSADFILGNRKRTAAMTLPQRFGNWLAPALIQLIWRHRFQDLGPQRAIRVEAFEKLAMRDRGFGWTVEMQVRAVEEKLRIVEAPVRSFPRPAGQSKISGNFKGSVKAGWIILQTIASLALRKKRN